MSHSYVGIDIADDPDKRSRVTLGLVNNIIIDINEVRPDYGPTLLADDLAALDSPLGYPKPLTQLIQSLDQADAPERHFKYRRTDDVVADHVADLQVVRDADNPDARVPGFFNRARHVKPTLGLQIVPGALRETIRLLNLGEQEVRARVHVMEQVRCGDLGAQVIEAHPRLFLYSALNRIRIGTDHPLPQDVLIAARDYKTPPAADHVEQAIRAQNRRYVLRFLREHTQHWIGLAGLNVYDRPPVCDRDHDFDALLCALTALAHDRGWTWSWADMGGGMDHKTVAEEGHIFILSPRGGAEGA